MSLALGYPHPDYLLGVLTSRQLSEWMAYYAIEPFGERAEWLRNGILASVIANAHRGKNSKTFKPEDFMPLFDDLPGTPKRQTVAEQREMLVRIFNSAKKRGLTKKD